MNVFEIKDKWEESGLLEGIADDRKIQLALYFEELVQHLQLKSFGELGQEDAYVCLLFPVVRRVYLKNLDKQINIPVLANDFKEYINTDYYKTLAKLFEYHTEVDMEAELMELFSDQYRL